MAFLAVELPAFSSASVSVSANVCSLWANAPLQSCPESERLSIEDARIPRPDLSWRQSLPRRSIPRRFGARLATALITTHGRLQTIWETGGLLGETHLSGRVDHSVVQKHLKSVQSRSIRGVHRCGDVRQCVDR